MDRDTAARALADAYTAARDTAPGSPLDIGRFMEHWLRDHGFYVVPLAERQDLLRFYDEHPCCGDPDIEDEVRRQIVQWR